MAIKELTKAQEATQAIERIYIAMRHLFNRGFYKPMGVSGAMLRESLLELQPEIYGSIAEDKVELNGLLYVLDRLPEGIEECAIIHLTGEENHNVPSTQVIIPPKRRRVCYRLNPIQMNIEITRGRSDIYDILTHLTFLFIESHKIAQKAVSNTPEEYSKEWKGIEKFISQNEIISKEKIQSYFLPLSYLLGRTMEEISSIYTALSSSENPHRFIKIIYWLGKLAIEEVVHEKKRTILFSPILRERTGHHFYGEMWANKIKETLEKQGLIHRRIHIISANMHSVMNYIFSKQVLFTKENNRNKREIFESLSQEENHKERNIVSKLASQNGMLFLKDDSGTNIDVQIFDLAKIDFSTTYLAHITESSNDVIIVMDYAFGEQAFETMDELLKPYFKEDNQIINLNVSSISIMGKAGILRGEKGDIMIPNAHIFEGTTDNYPFQNQITLQDFKKEDIHSIEGHMITVLGTSLQNKEVLKYFMDSTWDVVGLEMEGAHYQKAIQAASQIRKSVPPDLKVSYAYYASDNPLKTGSTLASGGLGLTGVKPTYMITEKFLEKILKEEDTKDNF